MFIWIAKRYFHLLPKVDTIDLPGRAASLKTKYRMQGKLLIIYSSKKSDYLFRYPLISLELLDDASLYHGNYQPLPICKGFLVPKVSLQDTYAL
jgi:hypothetical protein